MLGLWINDISAEQCKSGMTVFLLDMCDRNVIHCRFLESPDFLPNSAKRYIDQKFVLQVSINFESYCFRNNPIKLTCYQRWSGWLVLWRKIKMPWDKHLLISKPSERIVLYYCNIKWRHSTYGCAITRLFLKDVLCCDIFVPCKWISVKKYTRLHKGLPGLEAFPDLILWSVPLSAVDWKSRPFEQAF